MEELSQEKLKILHEVKRDMYIPRSNTLSEDTVIKNYYSTIKRP